MKAYRVKNLEKPEGGEFYGSKNPLVREYLYRRYDIALKMSNVSLESVVLDIGTGLGLFLPSLVLRAKEVYACDIDTGRLGRVKGLLTQELGDIHKGKLTLFEGNACALPLKKDSVDIVFMLDCLEHMPSPVNEMTLNEVKRVLKPGGKLICSLPVEKGFVLLLRALVGKLTGIARPRYSFRELIKASIHNSTIGEHRDHEGYDYLRDLRLMQDLFIGVSKLFSPLPFLHGLNPTVVIKAKK